MAESGMTNSIIVPQLANQVGRIDFRCPCGQNISEKKLVQQHGFTCMQMQQSGYATFVNIVSGLNKGWDQDFKSQQSRWSEADRAKFANLRNIFDMFIPPENLVRMPRVFDKDMEEEKKSHEDVDMIDSKRIRPLVDASVPQE